MSGNSVLVPKCKKLCFLSGAFFLGSCQSFVALTEIFSCVCAFLCADADDFSSSQGKNFLVGEISRNGKKDPW
jgi:hypothetical protein